MNHELSLYSPGCFGTCKLHFLIWGCLLVINSEYCLTSSWTAIYYHSTPIKLADDLTYKWWNILYYTKSHTGISIFMKHFTFIETFRLPGNPTTVKVDSNPETLKNIFSHLFFLKPARYSRFSDFSNCSKNVLSIELELRVDKAGNRYAKLVTQDMLSRANTRATFLFQNGWILSISFIL